MEEVKIDGDTVMGMDLAVGADRSAEQEIDLAPFEAGDVVSLKSGGSQMTVREVTVTGVLTQWFERRAGGFYDLGGTELRSANFDARMLIKVSR